ncbi:hypothetical protein DICVIV_14107, partial [Dictyocaulus viviparus]
MNVLMMRLQHPEHVSAVEHHLCNITFYIKNVLRLCSDAVSEVNLLKLKILSKPVNTNTTAVPIG